jgi:hypothetical protein
VTGGILASTPAGFAGGRNYVVTRGKAPVLFGDEMRRLPKSIDEISGADSALYGEPACGVPARRW